MSDPKTFGDWDTLWNEYSNALEKWREVFETFQKSTTEMQEKYNEVMQKASTESSKDTMKEFGENWQKAMNDAGINAFKQFGESWQKAMNDSGMESVKSYGEMMNKFADTWKKTWRS